MSIVILIHQIVDGERKATWPYAKNPKVPLRVATWADITDGGTLTYDTYKGCRDQQIKLDKRLLDFTSKYETSREQYEGSVWETKTTAVSRIGHGSTPPKHGRGG